MHLGSRIRGVKEVADLENQSRNHPNRSKASLKERVGREFHREGRNVCGASLVRQFPDLGGGRERNLVKGL
jgi:hypothetical protein